MKKIFFPLLLSLLLHVTGIYADQACHNTLTTWNAEDYAMIQFANDKFLNGEYPNPSFIEADARSFNFDQFFDLIISNYVLQWVKETSTAFKNIYNHLNRSGKFFCVIIPFRKNNAAFELRYFYEMV